MYVPKTTLANSSRKLIIDVYYHTPTGNTNGHINDFLMNSNTISSVQTTIGANFLSGLVSYTKYINQNDSINTALVGHLSSSSFYLSSSDHSADPSGIVINSLNINFIGAKSVAWSVLTQISNTVVIGSAQIGGQPTARVRFNDIVFANTLTITSSASTNANRHYFQNCVFQGALTFPSLGGNWLQFTDCEFSMNFTIPASNVVVYSRGVIFASGL